MSIQSALSITDLPQEVIVSEIFQKARPHEVVELAFVCKDFFRMISESQPLFTEICKQLAFRVDVIDEAVWRRSGIVDAFGLTFQETSTSKWLRTLIKILQFQDSILRVQIPSLDVVTVLTIPKGVFPLLLNHAFPDRFERDNEEFLRKTCLDERAKTNDAYRILIANADCLKSHTKFGILSFGDQKVFVERSGLFYPKVVEAFSLAIFVPREVFFHTRCEEKECRDNPLAVYHDEGKIKFGVNRADQGFLCGVNPTSPAFK